jgi:pimeloyl-ACP methyl ester carboxylesterase
MSGVGDDTTPAASVTLTTWIDDVLAFVEAQQAHDVVLVAHSFAGYVAAGALERQPRLFRRTVFLDAALPEPGRSWFDTAGPDTEAFMRSLATDHAIPWFSREQLDQMYPGHGISDTDFAWMLGALRPQPVATYAEPATKKPLDLTEVDAIYVRCAHAPAATPPDNYAGLETHRLDSNHWPMITAADQLSKLLLEFV